MSDCGCKVYGNQWGHFFGMCEEHAKMAGMVAAHEGITMEELLERAWEYYRADHYTELEEAQERFDERRRRREGRRKERAEEALMEHQPAYRDDG